LNNNKGCILWWKQENYKKQASANEDRLVVLVKQIIDKTNRLARLEKQLLSEEQEKVKGELKELEEGFWVTLPKQKLVGLCILAGFRWCGSWFWWHLACLPAHQVACYGFLRLNHEHES